MRRYFSILFLVCCFYTASAQHNKIDTIEGCLCYLLINDKGKIEFNTGLYNVTVLNKFPKNVDKILADSILFYRSKKNISIKQFNNSKIYDVSFFQSMNLWHIFFNRSQADSSFVKITKGIRVISDSISFYNPSYYNDNIIRQKKGAYLHCVKIKAVWYIEKYKSWLEKKKMLSYEMTLDSKFEFYTPNGIIGGDFITNDTSYIAYPIQLLEYRY